MRPVTAVDQSAPRVHRPLEVDESGAEYIEGHPRLADVVHVELADAMDLSVAFRLTSADAPRRAHFMLEEDIVWRLGRPL